MNNNIKIEKNVPFPPKKQKYPWHEMEIGDSFFIPVYSPSTLSVSGYGTKHYSPKKFSARKEGNGVRIWRIA